MVPPDNSLAEITLYAQWGLNQTITFDKNAADATCTGSTCADATTMNPQTINGGGSAALIANGYTRPGYVFGGWMNSADGTSSNYNDKASYSVAATNTVATKTLYARWIPAVTFEAGTGINTVIVTDGNQKYTPFYATPGNSVTIAMSAKRVIVTVVPEANYVLDSWTSNAVSGGGSLASYTLLTTTYTAGTVPEILTVTGTPATASNEYATMQDFSENDCPVTNASTLAGVNVTDSRDGKSYTVAKVNGHCFMLSNLRLDKTMDDGNGGTKTRILTAADSDIKPNDSYTEFTMPTAAWDNYYYLARMAISGGEYYYNWYAATANPSTTGSVNDGVALGSICPKGWTLPNYSDGINASTLWTSSTNVGMLSTSGSFLSGSQGGVGSSGIWWSSAWNSNYNAYYLVFDGSSAHSNYNNKYNGLSVRCMRSGS